MTAYHQILDITDREEVDRILNLGFYVCIGFYAVQDRNIPVASQIPHWVLGLPKSAYRETS